jgi:hypothetical protein
VGSKYKDVVEQLRRTRAEPGRNNG